MSQQPPKMRSHASREASTFTLAPLTITRLAQLSEFTGVSRGRLIDIAMANIEVCDVCEGAGQVEHQGMTEGCEACMGSKIVPREP